MVYKMVAYHVMISFTAFKKEIRTYYRAHKRSMPWRDNLDPYWIVVSEIMLQQTRVSRVMELFPSFIKLFPSFEALNRASRGEVLRAWQGLGYNRRAGYVHEIAHKVVHEYGGSLPQDRETLQTLKGVGPNTAASICVFAFNLPEVFVETNIRSVFLHFFFKQKKNVSDAEILKLVSKTIDVNHPREWYWALMDYGTYLKQTQGNPNVRSKHYAKQSVFRGSNRQVRGEMVRVLLAHPRGRTLLQLRKDLGILGEKLPTPLSQLVREKMVIYKKGRYFIA